MESDVTIRDVMTREYVGVSESDTVRGVTQLMREEEVTSAVVLRGSEPVGIVTEWDVVDFVADGRDAEQATVEDVMSAPVITIRPDERLDAAAGIMLQENIRNLLVEPEATPADPSDEQPANDEVIGVLTERDVIAAVASRGPVGSTNGVDDGDRTSEFPAGNPSDSRAAPPGENTVAPNGGYAEQGICEVCGSLTQTLRESNGQLVCADCRDV